MVNSWSRSWQLSTTIITGSHHVFKRHTAGKKRRLMPQWITQLTTGVIGMIVMYYSQSRRLLHRETSCAVAIYCFGHQKTIYEWSRRKYSYWYHSARMPFIRRHKSTRLQLHLCMSQVQKCLCIAEGLFISSLDKLSHSSSTVISVLLSVHITDVFQITGLLCRAFFFNERETKYFYIYLNEDFKSQVTIGSSSDHVVLNGIQWFILVAFKSNISKNEVQELGDPRHTLSMFSERHICITSENT